MKLQLQLEQLSCPTCALKIAKVAKQTKGVLDAEVMFISSRVKLEFDEDVTTKEVIITNIEKLGYKVLKVIWHEEVKTNTFNCGYDINNICIYRNTNL